METSGLLFVSVFCNIQRKPQFEGKYTKFSKYPMIHNEILWKLELFALNSSFYKQIFKKKFGDSDKKAYLCSNKSHHASQRCVLWWDFAFYMGI